MVTSVSWLLSSFEEDEILQSNVAGIFLGRKNMLIFLQWVIRPFTCSL